MLMTFFKPRKRARPTGFLGRLARDSRGVATVEMAIIAPIMIFAYYGVAEVSMAMMAHRRAAHAAAAVGDLVTQSAQMNTATMTDIFKIGTTMMRPFSETPLKIRVTSVKMNADTSVSVVWSKTSGGVAAKNVGDPVTDAKVKTLLLPYETLVVTEMWYAFDSPIDRALPNTLNFSDTTYLKPRQSDAVVWVN